MIVALCNTQMHLRTGTEIVTRDLALALARRGHAVHVFTGRTGALSDELVAAGVGVHRDQAAVPRPDVFHVNHMPFAAPLLALHPDVPALSLCHDAGDVNSTLTPSPQVAVWAGVSQACRQRIARETGVALHDVLLLPNAVDLSSAPPAAAPRSRPRIWLFVAEKPRSRRVEWRIRLLALWFGASLRIVGPKAFRPDVVDNLARLAADCDLVFATGRCALESAAAGAGVVVVDPRGVAGFLGVAGWERWKAHNLGLGSFSGRPSLLRLARAVRAWRRDEVAAVSAAVRRERDLERLVDELEIRYRAMARNP